MGYVIALPALWMLAVYVGAALIPAIVLLRYIYRRDGIEKEPAPLLVRLLLLRLYTKLDWLH